MKVFARFDGQEWTFSYRTHFQSVICCYSCDFVRPALHSVSVKEKEVAPSFFSPFCLKPEAPSIPQLNSEHDVMLFVEMEEDFSKGDLIVKGSNGNFSFNSELQARLYQDKTLPVFPGEGCRRATQVTEIANSGFLPMEFSFSVKVCGLNCDDVLFFFFRRSPR